VRIGRKMVMAYPGGMAASTAVRKERSEETVRANPQRQRAIAGWHEADRNERA
jgi:hypothetical protein